MKNTKAFKRGQQVWDASSLRRGGFITYNRDAKTAQVEFTINFNKETGERTSKVENIDVDNLRVYRSKSRGNEKKYNPDEMFWMVRQFHEAFDHPIGEKSAPLSLERSTNRSVWIGEEIVEGLQQSSSNEEEFLEAYDVLIAGLEKAKQKSLKESYPENDKDKLIGQSDALVDAMYFILGSFVEMRVRPFNLFKIVQNSNMSKLFPDGKPRYREEDGKILKSDSFIPPEPLLEKEIERQMNQ